MFQGWDLAQWFERLTVNVKDATVLGSIPASFDTSGIWGTADDTVLNKYLPYLFKKIPKIPLKIWGEAEKAVWKKRS